MPFKGKTVALPSYALPPQSFYDMHNFTYDGRKVPGLMPGWAKFQAASLGSDPVMLIDQFFLNDGTSYFFAITTGDFYLWDSGTSAFVSQSQTYTGDTTNIFSADIWSEPGAELYIFTNGKDVVQKFDGSSFGVLGGLTDAEPGSIVVSAARSVRTFKDFVNLYNTTEDGDEKPFRVRWGKKLYPEVWKNDATGLGEAGFTDLIETTDWIVAAERLNYYMVIYKERSVYFQEYVGAPTVMRFSRFVDGIGLLGERAIASMGDSHIFVGNDNIYELTTAALNPIGDDIKDEFFGLLNPGKHSQVIMFMAEEFDEIVLAFPSVNSDTCNMFYVYNFSQKNWSGPHDRNCTCLGYYQALNDTSWDDLVGAWSVQLGFWDERSFSTNSPINMMGDFDGYVYTLYNGLTAAGTAFDGYLEFGDDDITGDPHLVKRMQKIWADVESATSGSINLYIGTKENFDGPVSWNGPYTQTMQGQILEFDMDLSAKFFRFKFETVSGTPFKLMGMTVGYIPRGNYR